MKDAFEVMEIPEMRDAMDRFIESMDLTEAVVPTPLDFEEFYRMFQQNTRGQLRQATANELMSRMTTKELAYA